MICPKCGSEMEHKTGTGKKTGKKYSGSFCPNSQCKHVEWDQKDTEVQTTAQEIPLSLSSQPSVSEAFERIASALERIADYIADDLSGAVRKGNEKNQDNKEAF